MISGSDMPDICWLESCGPIEAGYPGDDGLFYFYIFNLAFLIVF